MFESLAEGDQIMLPYFGNRACRHVLQLEGTVGGADQSRHLEPEMLEDSPHLAILAFPEL